MIEELLGEPLLTKLKAHRDKQVEDMNACDCDKCKAVKKLPDKVPSPSDIDASKELDFPVTPAQMQQLQDLNARWDSLSTPHALLELRLIVSETLYWRYLNAATNKQRLVFRIIGE